MREMEETGLEDRVHPRPQPDPSCHLRGIDDVEVQFLVDDLLLDLAWKLIPDFVRSVGAVQQERSSRDRRAKHIKLVEKAEFVAGDEIGVPDQIGCPNRGLAETEMGGRRAPDL